MNTGLELSNTFRAGIINLLHEQNLETYLQNKAHLMPLTES